MISHEFWALPISFLVSLVMLRLLLSSRIARATMDQPNHRSLHTSPVPRTGGLAMLVGIFAGWAWLDHHILAMQFCVLALAVVSFADDLWNLGTGVRLVAQIFAVALLLWLEFASDQHYFWLLCTATAMVWMTNLYNFMDGSDGLAGGMTLFGFSCYAVASLLHGDPGFALICATIVFASAAFLMFNFHPARIFMGDVGSIPLGYSAAALGLFGVQNGTWPLWFPPLVFSPFIVDATAVLFKRLLRREKIWEAHRQHYYQRLIQMGWGHRSTAIAEYILMAATAFSALFLLNRSMPIIYVGLLLWAAVYLSLIWVIDKRWSATQRQEQTFR